MICDQMHGDIDDDDEDTDEDAALQLLTFETSDQCSNFEFLIFTDGALKEPFVNVAFQVKGPEISWKNVNSGLK